MNSANLGGFTHTQNEVPPFIEFFLDSEEDRAKTLENKGVLTMRDVHMVSLRQRGSKDFAVKRVDEWLVEMQTYSQSGRQPAHWYAEYVKAYEKWKNDMDGVQLNGYDLRKWPGISKAQLHNLQVVGIVTVEDVAGMTQTTVDRIGLGAMALKQRAKAWLEAREGQINVEAIAQARAERDADKARIAELEGQIATINAKLAGLDTGGAADTGKRK